MSLQVWLPLNGDLHNQGLCNFNQTINTSPTWTDNGKIGKAMMSGSITMPASAAEQILNNQAFSFACWIYVAAATGSTTDRAMLFGTNGMPENNNRKFSIFQYPTCNDLHLSWMNDAASTTFTGGVWSGIFPTGKWTHLAITYQNPSGKIYINGTQYATFSGISNSSSFAYDTRLFENCPNNGRYLNDYRIYNHCLSDKEVEEIAKGLVLHYKLDNNGLGGNNLALHTRDLNVGSSKTNLNMYIRGAATRQLRPDGFYESKTIANWQGLSFWANQLNLSVGTKITYSFYIYGNGSSRAFSFYPMMYNSAGTRDTTTGLPISVDGGSYTTSNAKRFGDTSATAPEYHYVTFEWNQAVADIISDGGSIELSIQVHGTWDSGDWACIFAPKVEIGEFPTTWSPAPSEINGTNTIYDSSGYNHNGTISGNIESISSPKYQIGSGALNNSNTTITTSINALPAILANGTKYTLACWARPTGTNANGWVIKLGGTQCGLWWAKSAARWVWNENDNGKRVIGTPIADDYTNWHHLVTTVDKTSITAIIAKHYVDGSPAEGYASQTWDGSSFTQPTGNNIICYLQNADLSDIRLYCTCLTEQQIKELYDTSATIDNKGNVYTREFDENDNLNLTKTGIFGVSNIYDNNELINASILKTDKQIQGNALYEY